MQNYKINLINNLHKQGIKCLKIIDIPVLVCFECRPVNICEQTGFPSKVSGSREILEPHIAPNGHIDCGHKRFNN